MVTRFIEQVLKNSLLYPDKAALITPTGQLTYGGLARHVGHAASWLQKQGVKPPDRVMVQAGASLIYVINYLAVQYLGAAVIPVDRNAVTDTVLHIHGELSASLFLGESKDFGALPFYRDGGEAWGYAGPNEATLYQPQSGDELSDLLFTTGTTGKSKGVMLSHRAILGGISNVINGAGMTPEDTILIPVPLNHSFGLRELRTALYLGATAVLMNGFAFAAALAESIKGNHCTCMACVPAAARVLYQQSKGKLHDVLGGLRYIEFCTAPLDPAMKQTLLGQLPGTTLLNSYGSTESAGAVYLDFSKDREKLLSIGRPVTGVQIKVLDGVNQPILAPTRECPGRLAIYGPMNMGGYWGAPGLTGETLHDGWVYTNDIAYLDGDGFIYLLGRANDVINVGGKKVSPVELEDAAILYPLVECCCIAAEDPKGILGSVPVLFVVNDAPVDTQQLKSFLAQKLEAYKLPAAIIQVGEIPKNYMGKTDRNALKALYKELQEGNGR